MNSFSKAIIVIAIVFAAGIGLLFWSLNRPHAEGPGLTKLSAEDVQHIIEDEAKGNPRALASLAESKEQRGKVLENLKQALAVAAEARNDKFADTPEMKTQLDLAQMEILATAYDNKLKADAGRPDDPGPPFGYIKDEEVNAFFDAPENKAKYDPEQEKFLAFLTSMQAKANVPQEMPEEQKKFVISQWKKVTYGAMKAKETGLDDHRTQLQYKLQQALILARAYSQEKLKDKLTPTEDEIKAYIASNPKFDESAAKTKIDEAMTKVKSGVDFGTLANEYSDDPGNKDMKTGAPQGGLYDWKPHNEYVKEFGDAAWALNEGEVTPEPVKTQFGYHIIKLEGKRVSKDKDGKDKEEVKVRHILVSTTYRDETNPMAPPMSYQDAAKQELAKEKQKKVLDDIVARNKIDLPEDFTITVPAEPAGGPEGMTPGMPPGMGPGGPGQMPEGLDDMEGAPAGPKGKPAPNGKPAAPPAKPEKK